MKAGEGAQDGTVSLSALLPGVLSLSVSRKAERAAAVQLTREQARRLRQALAELELMVEPEGRGEELIEGDGAPFNNHEKGRRVHAVVRLPDEPRPGQGSCRPRRSEPFGRVAAPIDHYRAEELDHHHALLVEPRSPQLHDAHRGA
jgi:hypothetical protein